ncbi:MAG TPA: hypothetical protein VD993_11835 [Chitinophagaceae bacterium]|nr:hypothetical protein [Chitinophagaceae bacterium]
MLKLRWFAKLLRAGFFASLILASCNERRSIHSESPDKPWPNLLEIKKIMNQHYQEDRYDSAIIYLDQLIATDSSNGEYYYKRGYSHSLLGNKELSNADFERAISFNHSVSNAYLNLGLNAVFDNDSLAMIYFKKSVAADSTNQKAAIQVYFCEMRLYNRQ